MQGQAIREKSLNLALLNNLAHKHSVRIAAIKTLVSNTTLTKFP